MKVFVQWIIFLLVNLSLCNYSVTAAVGASVLIYVNTSESSQSDCSSTNLSETLCDINIAKYSNYSLLLCSDLDTALNYISTTASDLNFAYICLLSRNVTLRKNWSLNISLVLTSYTADNPSVIQCHYNDTQNTSVAFNADDLRYSIFFYSVRFVRLEFVHFEGCPQPLRIELSYNVSILNCVFTNFKEAVLDIYNSVHVTISNSNFSNNSGTGNVLLPFRGNTGAVAIGYNKDKSISITNQTVLIQNCTFTNNRANVSEESFFTSSNIVAQGVFTGRGGGLGLLVNESFHNVTALITNCSFINNFASSFGGGVYVVFNGTGTQHTVTVDNCDFVNNTGTLGAGGINIAYLTNGELNYPITAVIRNCYLFGNQGETGGATYIFPASRFGGDGNVAFIENTIYENNEASNFGGAIAAATYSLFRTKELLPLYRIFNRLIQYIQ